MATKATNQITITDITDAYSVMLTSESVNVPGGTSGATSGSAKTSVYAMRGGDYVTPSITKSEITFHTLSGSVSDVLEVVGNIDTTNPNQPEITFGVVSGKTLSETIEATIPVKLDNGTITINKKFSFGVNKTGPQGATGPQGPQGATGPQGPQGDDGEDAIQICISTDNGNVFKNSTGNTILTPEVYVGGVQISVGAASTAGKFPVVINGTTYYLYWYKGDTKLDSSNTGSASTKFGEFVTGTPNGRLKVYASQVSSKQAYNCKLEDA